MFIVNVTVHSTKDHFNNGLEGQTSLDREWEFKAKNTDEILKEIESQGFEKKDINIFDGRLEASRLENADGDKPSQKEMTAWYEGRRTLYYCDYSFYLSYVTDCTNDKLKELFPTMDEI